MVVGYEVQHEPGDSVPPSLQKPSRDWNPRISVFTLWPASHFFPSLQKKVGEGYKSQASLPPPKQSQERLRAEPKAEGLPPPRLPG